MSVYVRHSANLSQSQGSDKNATALRGAYFGMEWRGGDGGGEVRGNLQGRGWRDSRHSFRPKLVTKGTLEVLRVEGGAGDGATDKASAWRKRAVTGRTGTVVRPF